MTMLTVSYPFIPLLNLINDDAYFAAENFLLIGMSRWPIWCPFHKEIIKECDNGYESTESRKTKSKDECYYTVKGALLPVPHSQCLRTFHHNMQYSGEIQQHLDSMLALLRPEDTLKMAVKLESAHLNRSRYLVVVSTIGRQDTEECCLLGMDCNSRATIGMVLEILANMTITLDGDGGFSLHSGDRNLILKPVSVQALWSALQFLHKACARARECMYFLKGYTHEWVAYYTHNISSEQSCLNEWNILDDLEARRPPSPDLLPSKPTEKEETEKLIRDGLRKIMTHIDLDEVTSKFIRTQLEEDMGMDLSAFKSFIDSEMLTILGQLDSASCIFPYLFLGSAWNAADLRELQRNEITRIVNVTREVDNFFPGLFEYLNIRVFDDEATELLKHWAHTYQFISRACSEGAKVFVHCKMGVSRSAAVVIAYAMKAYGWSLSKALNHVRSCRACVQPNESFLQQLEIYQGMLSASKLRHSKLFHSDSEASLCATFRIFRLSHENRSIDRPQSWPSESGESERNQSHRRSLSSGSRPTKLMHANLLIPCKDGHAYNVTHSHVFNLYAVPALVLNSDTRPSSLFECVNPLFVTRVRDRVHQLEAQANRSRSISSSSGSATCNSKPVHYSSSPTISKDKFDINDLKSDFKKKLTTSAPNLRNMHDNISNVKRLTWVLEARANRPANFDVHNTSLNKSNSMSQLQTSSSVEDVKVKSLVGMFEQCHSKISDVPSLGGCKSSLPPKPNYLKQTRRSRDRLRSRSFNIFRTM